MVENRTEPGNEMKRSRKSAGESGKKSKKRRKTKEKMTFTSYVSMCLPVPLSVQYLC